MFNCILIRDDELPALVLSGHTAEPQGARDPRLRECALSLRQVPGGNVEPDPVRRGVNLRQEADSGFRRREISRRGAANNVEQAKKAVITAQRKRRVLVILTSPCSGHSLDQKKKPYVFG